MMPVKAWRQLDGLFRDLNNNHTPMGGQFFILTGDFAQRLPIVPLSNKANIIQQSLPSWEHWNKVSIHRLTENMRTEDGAIQFTDWLL